ncbi:MAG: hypothetical protein HYX79_04285 [Chloroflexi bacterium]|nr:hypothetical protein [Chloroflexota bacterium]
MEDNPISLTGSEIPQGVNSLLAGGEVKCDKCGETIKHLERYCSNSHECFVCGTALETVMLLEGHFSQEHSGVASRGTRYCVNCSLKAGYLKTVKNKKTDTVFPAMFVLRDELSLE